MSGGEPRDKSSIILSSPRQETPSFATLASTSVERVAVCTTASAWLHASFLPFSAAMALKEWYGRGISSLSLSDLARDKNRSVRDAVTSKGHRSVLELHDCLPSNLLGRLSRPSSSPARGVAPSSLCGRTSREPPRPASRLPERLGVSPPSRALPHPVWLPNAPQFPSILLSKPPMAVLG